MIQGLEQDNYCSNVALPVWYQDSGNPDIHSVVFSVDVNGVQTGKGRIYKSINYYYLNISDWVALYFKKLEDLKTYTSTLQSLSNPSEMEVVLTIVEEDEWGEVINLESVTKTFFNCNMFDGIYIANTDEKVKAWKGYPFSWLSDLNTVQYQILNTKPTIPNKYVELDTNECKGTYIKWLNEYGNYNYWLFPKSRDERTEGEEIFRINRNIFGYSYKFSNEFTVGFEGRKFITVRDIVNKDFWYLFDSLVTSPEVYVLKDSWEVGTDAGPEDWYKIIQSDVEFERTRYQRNTAELEFEFELPKPYTQKLI